MGDKIILIAIIINYSIILLNIQHTLKNKRYCSKISLSLFSKFQKHFNLLDRTIKTCFIFHNGPYIKYIGGEQEDFAEIMKYFRHILMGHKKLLKIFDGPQNIFYVLS